MSKVELIPVGTVLYRYQPWRGIIIGAVALIGFSALAWKYYDENIPFAALLAMCALMMMYFLFFKCPWITITLVSPTNLDYRYRALLRWKHRVFPATRILRFEEEQTGSFRGISNCRYVMEVRQVICREKPERLEVNPGHSPGNPKLVFLESVIRDMKQGRSARMPAGG